MTLGDLGLDDFAISAITGHKLTTIKAMLEVYGPRNQFQAARGVVARITPRALNSNPTDRRIGPSDCVGLPPGNGKKMPAKSLT